MQGGPNGTTPGGKRPRTACAAESSSDATPTTVSAADPEGEFVDRLKEFKSSGAGLLKLLPGLSDHEVQTLARTAGRVFKAAAHAHSRRRIAANTPLEVLLPIDELQLVVGFLPPEDLAVAQQVCRHFHTAVDRAAKARTRELLGFECRDARFFDSCMLRPGVTLLLHQIEEQMCRVPHLLRRLRDEALKARSRSDDDDEPRAADEELSLSSEGELAIDDVFAELKEECHKDVLLHHMESMWSMLELIPGDKRAELLRVINRARAEPEALVPYVPKVLAELEAAIDSESVCRRIGCCFTCLMMLKDMPPAALTGRLAILRRLWDSTATSRCDEHISSLILQIIRDQPPDENIRLGFHERVAAFLEGARSRRGLERRRNETVSSARDVLAAIRSYASIP